ncbi:MAG TPA: AMP-binding protein, partial [Terriglobales bacterium]|nr:AMP-binding protein [Terriglobales bacterium]
MGSSGPVSSQINEIDSDKIALRQGHASLTYAELNRRADLLAAHLINTGLRPFATVAICLERSFDWVIAALAVMRAGAAYVPMDDAWPDERVSFAVVDSDAKHLIAHADRLRRLDLDVEGIDPKKDAFIASQAGPPTRPKVSPDDLAYIIYTSGTSGYPKGVEVTHSNLSHLVDWHCDAFGVTSHDRASHLAGLSFDAAGWEIWPYLARGASISLVDEITRTSPELLQQWLLAEQITISYVPTALALPLTQLDWPNETPLRFVLTGGERLHRAPARPLPFVLVNNYGPTECTVVSTSGVVECGSSSVPSIGRPIGRTRIYLLDKDGTAVPQGAVGEICIGGPGVGRGYRNLPGLTAGSFLPDPFSSRPNARMY